MFFVLFVGVKTRVCWVAYIDGDETSTKLHDFTYKDGVGLLNQATHSSHGCPQ